jgi:branched-chain amino acid transport system permease protein
MWDVLAPIIRWPLYSPARFITVVVVTLVAVVLIVRAVRRTRPGRAMIGIRDNERAAEAMALASTRLKLQTFVFSGCIAGLAGGLYVIHQLSIGTGTFHPPMSIDVFAYAVIGGLGSIGGVITGVALFFTTPPDRLPAFLQTVQVKG